MDDACWERSLVDVIEHGFDCWTVIKTLGPKFSHEQVWFFLPLPYVFVHLNAPCPIVFILRGSFDELITYKIGDLLVLFIDFDIVSVVGYVKLHVPDLFSKYQHRKQKNFLTGDKFDVCFFLFARSFAINSAFLLNSLLKLQKVVIVLENLVKILVILSYAVLFIFC